MFRDKQSRTQESNHGRSGCPMPLCATNEPISRRPSRRSSNLSFLSAKTKRSTFEFNRAKKMETNIAAHFLTDVQLEQVFDTNLEYGLSEEHAKEQLKIDGLNELPQEPDLTLCKMFASNLFGWFPLMLWFAGFLSIGIHFIQYVADSTHESNENLYLGVIIIMVVLFTGLFAFYQEAKNFQVMKGFKDLIPRTAHVIRDGRLRLIPVNELVVGDLVEMGAGEVVPADVRLTYVSSFRIDMSSITGEALPLSRTTTNTHDNPLETKNLAFFSCMITEGTARGIVVATGDQTVIGRIAGLASGVEKEETPIAMEIKKFLRILCVVAFVLGGIFFFMVTFIQSSWIAGFYYMTGIVIANVPEGLLVTLTVSLTLTAKKLKSKNCLVKKLQAVETLGAMSCICSDKTGTLTENCMSVSNLSYDLQIISMDEELENEGDTINPLILAACLCLRAEFLEDDSVPEVTRKIKGDASEKAVLRYMEMKFKATQIRNNHPKVCEIPFNSEWKYQLSIHVLENGTGHILTMKGAPEIVIEYCSSLKLKAEDRLLGVGEKKSVRDICINLGNRGERVLAYCDFYLPPKSFPVGFKFNSDNRNFPMTGFRFLGLISLIDPPRESVPLAIDKCRSAGIKVIMVTGDHPITALAISRKVGIISQHNNTPYDDAFRLNADPKQFKRSIDPLAYKALVITGEDLRHMTNRELDLIVEHVDEITFARTSPQQKLIIVEACQRIGHVVGVTGDGVNDSPALKKADVGIAMGITGTDVSKQAADMILLDDNFSSIILGVEEGRLIFDNLKKCIAFTLTSNLPEMVPFILYATIGIPLPIHALLIICINVLTDLWPAISLAYEKAEADIMSKPPRNLDKDNLVTWKLISMTYFQIGLIQVVAALTGYFAAMQSFGFSPGSLLFTREEWNSKAVNDFQDDYGQEWTYEDRKVLETLAQSTYYASIVIVQIADVIICKTRRLSLLRQGMLNHMLNVGILMELGISLILLYVPFFNQYIYTEPVPWQLWLPSLPFAFIIIIVDEIRRFFIRKYPNGWVERELYW